MEQSQSSDTEAATSFTSHHDSNEEASTLQVNPTQLAIKILLTNVESGSILGRSGRTISEIQSLSNSRIKLSQSGEYYPGANVPSRVCLVQGTLGQIKEAVELIFLKLYELQAFHQTQPPPRDQSDDSNFQVDLTKKHDLTEPFSIRLLVPTSSCGMLIGRAGSNIKHLKEQSGVTFIQLSQKGNDDIIAAGGISVCNSTSERIVTIAGPNFQSCVECVHLILAEIALNPEIFRYVNMTTRYTKAMAEMVVHHASLYGPPSSTNAETMFSPEPVFASNIGLQLQYSDQISNSSISCNPSIQEAGHHQYDYGVVSPMRQTSHAPLEYQSYSPQSTSSSLQVQTTPPSLLPRGLNSPIDQLSHDFQQHNLGASPPQQLQHPDISTEVTFQMGVPEYMVGSILGRGGIILNELQSQSNTRILLSQRGEFLPGTNQRIVTITGLSPDVANAQYLISERITANRSKPR